MWAKILISGSDTEVITNLHRMVMLEPLVSFIGYSAARLFRASLQNVSATSDPLNFLSALKEIVC